jgi:hypothetical protein
MTFRVEHSQSPRRLAFSVSSASDPMIYPQITFPFELHGLPFRAAEATLPS